MPHVVAIGSNVTTYTLGNFGGTSAAAAMTGGMVASLQEVNSALKSWPEVVQPAMMVAASHNTEGLWLDLHDTLDDGRRCWPSERV